MSIKSVNNQDAIILLQLKLRTLTDLLIKKGIATEDEIQEQYELTSVEFLKSLEK